MLFVTLASSKGTLLRTNASMGSKKEHTTTKKRATDSTITAHQGCGLRKELNFKMHAAYSYALMFDVMFLLLFSMNKEHQNLFIRLFPF